MRICKAILLFLNIQFVYSDKWIDPHDMNRVGEHNSIKNDNFNSEIYSKTGNTESVSLSHYKRLISILLSSIDLRENDFNYMGYLSVDMSEKNYNFLKDFINCKDSDCFDKLRNVDRILSTSIYKSSAQNVAEFIISWNDYLYHIFNNSNTIILISTIFVLLISYKLLKARLTIWSVVKYLLFFGWVVDFAFTWINLVQESEINRIVGLKRFENILPQCDPNKMSTLQYLWSFISTPTDCREYHSLMYKEQFWTVPPLVVISHQLGIVIYTPAALLGKAFGSFTSGLLSTLPWGINIILLPVLLMFAAVIVCIILSFITQTSFGFKILHIFQINLGNRHREAIGDVLTGRNLSRLLELTHRRFVEDVRITNNDENKNNAQGSNCSEKSKLTEKPNETVNEPSTSNTLCTCGKTKNKLKIESGKKTSDLVLSNEESSKNDDAKCATLNQKFDGSGDCG